MDCTDTERKYLLKFDVDYNTMAALRSIENLEYRIQQSAQQKWLALMDIIKK
jgi:hypothetical protein